MKIVIVDDDILVASALKTILEAGEDVTVAGTGQDGSEALSLYREHRPDVLLMDIRMQKVSGLDASKQIMKEYPEARILLLTTFAECDFDQLYLGGDCCLCGLRGADLPVYGGKESAAGAGADCEEERTGSGIMS